MISLIAAEPVQFAIFRVQQERYGRESLGLHHNRMEERGDFIAIGCDFVCRISHHCGFFLRLFLGVLVVVLFTGATRDVALRFISGGFVSPFRDICG